MRDYLNQPIEVGDKVAFIRGGCRTLETAEVTKLVMFLVYFRDFTMRHPNDVIVIEKASA